MTDIDLTAAIRPTSDAIYRQLSGQYGDFSTPSDEEAEAVLKAALPHILAQVEARVKPTREYVARALSVADVHHPDFCDCGDFDAAQWCDGLEQQIDAVLALLPGRTEQEIREEIAEQIQGARGIATPEQRKANG